MSTPKMLFFFVSKSRKSKKKRRQKKIAPGPARRQNFARDQGLICKGTLLQLQLNFHKFTRCVGKILPAQKTAWLLVVFVGIILPASAKSLAKPFFLPAKRQNFACVGIFLPATGKTMYFNRAPSKFTKIDRTFFCPRSWVLPARPNHCRGANRGRRQKTAPAKIYPQSPKVCPRRQKRRQN